MQSLLRCVFTVFFLNLIYTIPHGESANMKCGGTGDEKPCDDDIKLMMSLVSISLISVGLLGTTCEVGHRDVAQ